MNVKELLSELQNHNPDMEVALNSLGVWTDIVIEVKTVHFTEKDKGFYSGLKVLCIYNMKDIK